MPDTIKKRIGICLCIIFACCLINTILERIQIELESIYITARHSWGLLTEIISILAILYIAFNRKINSNIYVKAGASLLTAYSIIFIINCLSLLIEKKWLIEFTGVAGLIFLIIYIISLLLFYWGTKSWVFIKVAITCGLIPQLLTQFAFNKINPSDDYEIYEKNVQSYIETVEISNILFIIIYAVSLILTVVWLSTGGKKVSSLAKANQNTVGEPKQKSDEESKSALINKIPHK